MTVWLFSIVPHSNLEQIETIFASSPLGLVRVCFYEILFRLIAQAMCILNLETIVVPVFFFFFFFFCLV